MCQSATFSKTIFAFFPIVCVCVCNVCVCVCALVSILFFFIIISIDCVDDDGADNDAGDVTATEKYCAPFAVGSR